MSCHKTSGEPAPSIEDAPTQIVEKTVPNSLDTEGHLPTSSVKKVATREELLNAIKNDEMVSQFDVSAITDMSGMFDEAENFNQAIEDWDVSNVINMNRMFWHAKNFNQPIGKWDVSHVTDMSEMLGWTRFFNQPIGNWNVSNVKDMHSMFYEAKAFNQPIGNWNVSNVTNMREMFKGAWDFNQPIVSWDVSKVRDMRSMFYGASVFNQPIGSWDVSNVKDMSSMFYATSQFNQPIGNWNVSNVIDMSMMFADAKAFNHPLDTWDVSNVTDMHMMFFGAKAFNQDLSQWDVGHVENAENIFFNSGLSEENYCKLVTTNEDWFILSEEFVLSEHDSKSPCRHEKFKAFKSLKSQIKSQGDISNWDVSDVKNMRWLFRNREKFNQPIEKWNVSNVVNMRGMFHGAKSFNQPIGNWDVSHVTDMRAMFKGAITFNQPIGNWDVSKVTNMHSMFEGISECEDSDFEDISKCYQSSSFNQAIGAWDVSNVTDMSDMFKLADIFNQDMSDWNVSNVKNMQGMFWAAKNFNQPIGKWDVSKVTDMQGMFWGAEKFNQDLSQWDVSHVKDAESIFRNSGLDQENYCKMITTNEGWKRLNEAFDWGILYPCDGIYTGKAANCSTETMPEWMHQQWKKMPSGHWVCQNRTGCDFCNEHYIGNVHIENNKVKCGRYPSDVYPNTKCEIIHFVDEDDLKLSERHQIHVTANEDISWKTIEHPFEQSIFEIKSTKNIANKLAIHLDKTETQKIKHVCVAQKEIKKFNGFKVQMIGCGGYDEHEYTTLYLSLTRLVDGKTSVYEVDTVGLNGFRREDDNILNDYKIDDIMIAPFLDTTGYYIRIYHTENDISVVGGGYGKYTFDKMYDDEIHIFQTLFLAGDPIRRVIKWTDTSYVEHSYAGSDADETGDYFHIEYIHSNYVAITPQFDGKEFTYTRTEIESRDEAFKIKAQQAAIQMP